MESKPKQNCLKPGKFVCPPNFEQVEGRSVLYSEDLEDEDTELWIIQAPIGLDMSKFENHLINLEGCTHVSFEDKSTPTLQCCASSSVDNSDFHLVVPRKSDKKLSCVSKRFKGHLLITEDFEIPEIPAVPKTEALNSQDEIENSDLTHDIKKDPDEFVAKRHKKKRQTSDKNIEDSHLGIEEMDFVPTTNTVINTDTDNTPMIVDPDEFGHKIKKKKHKKKSDRTSQSTVDQEFGASLVKTEPDDLIIPFSDDLQLSNRNGKKKKHRKELKTPEQISTTINEDVEIKIESSDQATSLLEDFSMGKKAKKKKKKKDC